MLDRSLANDIHHVVEDLVPAAPWLDDRVMASLAELRANRTARRIWTLDIRFALPSIAAALIAALAVGVLIGSRGLSHTAPTPVHPPNQAMTEYRSMLNNDLNHQIMPAYHGNIACVSRTQCISRALTTKAQTQALLHDMAAVATPPQFAAAAANIRTAALHLQQQVDVAVAAMETPGSDYQAIYDAINLIELKLAIGVIDCWPAAPVLDESLPDAYKCTTSESIFAN